MNCEEFVVSLLQDYQRVNYDLKEDNDKLQKENNMMKELINRLLKDVEFYTHPNNSGELIIYSTGEELQKMDKLFKKLNIPSPFREQYNKDIKNKGRRQV